MPSPLALLVARPSSSDRQATRWCRLSRAARPFASSRVDASQVEVGDIVLARVAGAMYLHLVSAVDHDRARVQISNNRGRVNGSTGHAHVYGICTVVNRSRPDPTLGRCSQRSLAAPRCRADPLRTRHR